MSLVVVGVVLLAGFVAVSSARQVWAGRLAFTIARMVVSMAMRLIATVLPVPSWLLRTLGAVYGDRAQTAVCQNGCGQTVSLVGLVQCSCGLANVRHAFAPCVACGLALRHMACPHCGLGILRPGWSTQGFEPRRYR